MVILHSKTLLDAPVKAVNLALEGDLAIRHDHNFVLPFLTGKEELVWAEINDEPVGCQVWSKKQEGRVWWYEISYVIPEFRGQGILATIRKEVRRLASCDADVKFIEYFIATDNEAMKNSIEKVGMKPANYHYRYVVEKK